METTKYKAIQPLKCMELQKFYKKVKLYKLTYFLVNKTKYKLFNHYMVWKTKDLTKRNQQRLVLPTQSHSFKTTVILIATNIDKSFFGKNDF